MFSLGIQAAVDIYAVQKLGRWKTISMVMRYAHHHPESLRAGIEILDRVPAGVSTVLAQSANHAVAVAGSESAVSRKERRLVAGGRYRSHFSRKLVISLRGSALL